VLFCASCINREGTSGIDKIAAKQLAQMGARIVLIARDKSRGEASLTRLLERAPGLAHTVHYADLARISEMKRVAAEIAHKEPRIDVLINNAGAMFSSRRLTEDGLEYTFALTHMAYFVVTEGLRERLLDSTPARIINTASAAHRGARLDFGDLQSAKGFGAMKAYSRSKLCNILFTRELVCRLHGTGVTANCLHPGFVATRFGDQSGGVISRWLLRGWQPRRSRRRCLAIRPSEQYDRPHSPAPALPYRRLLHLASPVVHSFCLSIA
jgi:NAD(P)-dependent dehydrogenase (short-subunit alcohol dehydrogenase family)